VFPYQLIGMGTGVELTSGRLLRLGLSYSFGISLTRANVSASHYGEGFFGVRVVGERSESRGVPTQHALFLEGGLVTGSIDLELCGGSACPETEVARPPTETRQLVFPALGLRYVFHSDVRSEQQDERRRTLMQVHAHAVARPLWAPRGPRYLSNGDEAGPAGFGARVGTELPLGRCITGAGFGGSCASAGLSAGYAPFPRVVWLDLAVVFPLY
jgi:hypothetical protein